VEQTQVRTKLAEWRVKRGVTQRELARATGIGLSTYWKLERGRIKNPPIRHLILCAIALGCDLDDLIEDYLREWPEWSYPRPDPKTFWRTAPDIRSRLR
jgi:transcriptional regulator with XRE-family HTH domain